MIKDILEELFSSGVIFGEAERKEEYILDALAQIKEELLGKLPKEKLIQEGIHIFIDNIAFNDCLSQITKIIKELR